jgi:hypothetical protein
VENTNFYLCNAKDLLPKLKLKKKMAHVFPYVEENTLNSLDFKNRFQ